MLSVTPSKLADFLACPHKYKLKHVEKKPEDGCRSSSPALSFGISMHKALREIHEAGIQNLSFGDAVHLLESYWDESAYAGTEMSDDYMVKGGMALARYCENYPEPEEHTIGVEVYLSCIIKSGGLQVRLGCKADRIKVDAAGVLEVIDYKTNASGTVPTVEFLASDLSVFLYYALARISYPQYERIRVTYLNVMSSAKSTVEFTPALVAANRSRLLEVLRILNESAFTPRQSESCAWCPYQDICPATGGVFEFSAII